MFLSVVEEQEIAVGDTEFVIAARCATSSSGIGIQWNFTVRAPDAKIALERFYDAVHDRTTPDPIFIEIHVAPAE